MARDLPLLRMVGSYGALVRSICEPFVGESAVPVAVPVPDAVPVAVLGAVLGVRLLARLGWVEEVALTDWGGTVLGGAYWGEADLGGAYWGEADLGGAYWGEAVLGVVAFGVAALDVEVAFDMAAGETVT